MARPKTDNIKVQIVMSAELGEKLNELSKQTGISKSALCVMALNDKFNLTDGWRLKEEKKTPEQE